MALISALAAMALADPTAIAAAAAPMMPTGRWNVDYGATACTLGRVYGTGKAETVMALRMMPLGSSLDLMVYTNDRNDAMRLGTATIAMEGGGSDESRFESYPTQARGKRMTRMPVDTAMFEALPTDAVLRVAPEKMPGWAFALPNAKAAFEALAKCNDSTAKVWGVDPTERSRIAEPAEPIGGRNTWIRTDDYPMSVFSKRAQGTTMMLWAIGLDGRVADCRIVATSGEPELDKAACRALALRARYTPAKGSDGKPVVSHSTRKVVWRLPGAWSGKQ